MTVKIHIYGRGTSDAAAGTVEGEEIVEEESHANTLGIDNGAEVGQ